MEMKHVREKSQLCGCGGGGEPAEMLPQSYEDPKEAANR